MKTVFYSLDTEAPSLGQNRFEYFCSVKLFPTPLNEVSKGGMHFVSKEVTAFKKADPTGFALFLVSAPRIWYNEKKWEVSDHVGKTEKEDPAPVSCISCAFERINCFFAAAPHE